MGYKVKLILTFLIVKSLVINKLSIKIFLSFSKIEI